MGKIIVYGDVELRGTHTFVVPPVVVPIPVASLPSTATPGTIITVSDDPANPLRVFLSDEWISIPNAASVGSSWYIQEWVITDGQTLFTLDFPVLVAESLSFLVNGVVYNEGVDFTRVDQTITWTNAQFTMGIDDCVLAHYLREG